MRVLAYLAFAIVVTLTIAAGCGGGDGSIFPGGTTDDGGSTDDSTVPPTPDGGFGGDTSVDASHGGCIPKTCAQQGYSCGPNGDGCGGLLQCGSCVAPQYCGGGGYSKCGGVAGNPDGGSICVAKTCAQLGFNCGPAGDGCGGLLQSCGSCTMPDICGGGGVPGVCGDNSMAVDAGCVNLCKQQVACETGTTTITGTVYAPTDPTKGYGMPDPLYDALVYVPNAPVQPFGPGVSCDQCGAAASGQPLVTFTTGPDGKFTLSNAPCGTNIPMVIQLGRWRRQIVIPNVTCCANTALTPDQTRLPRNKSEGDIPLMALTTGSADPIECVLPKIGIDLAEFTDPSGTGRVRFYQDTNAPPPNLAPGVVIDTNTPNDSVLYGSATELAKYDMVIIDCIGGQVDVPQYQANMLGYANSGGRVFASHYGYVWLYNIAPFNTTAAWNVNQPAPNDPLTADIDTSFQKGMDFAKWLGIVGALSAPNQITVGQPRHDADMVNVPPSQRFLYEDAVDTYPNTPVEFTFNTPVGSMNQCGRVLFSDFHVNTGGMPTTIPTFPQECPVAPMTPQEKVLEFMLFDLASCVQQVGPPPPTCTPLTCAQQGIKCGPAGDGCGNLIPSCGSCATGQTCGGGGQGGVCGSADGGVCKPVNCQQLNIDCGPAGDGCGGLLQCGTCMPPQTCGGGGVPGQCGGGTK